MNWFFHEAEAGARSQLFLVALRNEGRKKLEQTLTHDDLVLLSYRDFYKNCVNAFKVWVNFTMERIKLYSSWYMEANESFLSFHSRLSAHAACSKWSATEKKSVVRELFKGRVRDTDVQSRLGRKNHDHDRTLKLALELEKGASASMDFQKILPHNKNSSPSSLLQIK